VAVDVVVDGIDEAGRCTSLMMLVVMIIAAQGVSIAISTSS
jgi:hypothetical protein